MRYCEARRFRCGINGSGNALHFRQFLGGAALLANQKVAAMCVLWVRAAQKCIEASEMRIILPSHYFTIFSFNKFNFSNFVFSFIIARTRA